MAQQTLFKDLTKRLSDLLTKEFPSEKQENKIEWKGETAQDVTIESHFITKKDGSILGTFIPKYKYLFNGWNTTLGAEINTKKEVKGEVTIEGTTANVNGLKTIISGQNKDDDVFGTLQVEYKHEVYSASATVDYGKAKGSTVKGALVVGRQGFYLGLSSEYFLGLTEESDLKEIHSVLGYASQEFDLSAFGKLDGKGDEDKNEFGASYFHNINGDLAVGTEISLDTANPEAKPRLVFGGQYKLNTDTTLKGKFDTSGKLGLSYQQKFNKNTRLTLSSTVDTHNLSGKGASTFGFNLALSG